MPAHAAHEGPGPVARGTHLPQTRRTAEAGHARWEWGVPVTGGIALGLYAVFISSETGNSAGHAWLVGLVTALVSIAVGHVLLRERHRMVAEVRAAAFGAFFGICMGFLCSLSGGSVLRSTAIGLPLGIGMGLISYYVFYAHEH
ncbi:hypothetical protein AB0A70_22765 [Streptomyces morookaense]|uniref:hypothetical protein n=1 Tax=Streptomyces morookaense TaxID=1970 RepID=UPI0033D8ABDE